MEHSNTITSSPPSSESEEGQHHHSHHHHEELKISNILQGQNDMIKRLVQAIQMTNLELLNTIRDVTINNKNCNCNCKKNEKETVDNRSSDQIDKLIEGAKSLSDMTDKLLRSSTSSSSSSSSNLIDPISFFNTLGQLGQLNFNNRIMEKREGDIGLPPIDNFNKQFSEEDKKMLRKNIEDQTEQFEMLNDMMKRLENLKRNQFPLSSVEQAINNNNNNNSDDNNPTKVLDQINTKIKEQDEQLKEKDIDEFLNSNMNIDP